MVCSPTAYDFIEAGHLRQRDCVQDDRVGFCPFAPAFDVFATKHIAK